MTKKVTSNKHVTNNSEINSAKQNSTNKNKGIRFLWLYSIVTITRSHSICAYFEDIIVLNDESQCSRPARLLVLCSFDRL
jgi:hypothetical protein